ncbi:MAG TPA: M48 family metalloprotease [Candidatus Binatia bacterium]
MSRRSILALPLLAALAAVPSCTPVNLAPIGSGAQAFQAEKDEQKLWETADQIQTRLQKSGLLYEDRELEAYLEAVAAKLLAGRLQAAQVAPRVKVIKHPFLNAFTLPNGSIYFHSGLLARMDNEAQLATIMGHELTHFINRHTAKELRNAQNKVVAARVLQVVLVGTLFGSLADPLPALWASASVSGYSKDLETEADEDGLRAMVEAGYDPNESINAFNLLNQERDETKVKEPFFFGTHPLLEERIGNYRRLLNERYQGAAQRPDRRANTEEYRSRIHQVLLDNAMLDLELGRTKIAQLAIDKHLARDPNSARGHFIMGELCRRTRRMDEALKAYLQAASLDAQYADPHRELGLLYRAQSRSQEARAEFEKYLALKPTAIDAPIIAGYVKESRAP